MIQNIWAVGRNYSAHAKEMGSAVPTQPMIFLKAGSAATFEKTVTLFKGSKDIHHEIEVALRFSSEKDSAGRLYFDQVALALDLTARDLQAELKKQSHPWTLAKSFKESCPMSTPLQLKNEKKTEKLPIFLFELSVNGEKRQTGNTKDMIFDFETLRAYVQDSFPVVPGDWLLTGTPEGVGPLKSADRAEARLTSSVGHEIKAQWLFQ